MQQPGTCRPPSLGSPGRSFRTLNRVVGRGKWPGLIELLGAVWTADPSRHTRRPAVMPPTARIAPHMCSKREPFSATQVRQTIRSFTAYDAADATAAWNRRRRELKHLAGIIDVLTDVERRADELNRRAAELVEGWL